MRAYFGESVYLRAEGRLQFWKLSYPTQYFIPPADYPDDPPLLNPVLNSDAEWTTHPTLLVGLG